jgi:N-methylhydantoinase A/oxoprolinase/acetone carboxylase beta subunit
MITGAWRGLQERVAEEFAKSSIEQDRIEFTHAVRMQYFGQLNDIEIVSPHMELEEGSQVDDLIAEFEDAYAKVYARSARSPELGYLVTQAIVLGRVPVEKPALPELEDRGQRTEDRAKGSRRVWWREGFVETDIYDLEAVGAGHVVEGPAVLESPATTFAIPPGRRARLDEHQIFHMEPAG